METDEAQEKRLCSERVQLLRKTFPLARLFLASPLVVRELTQPSGNTPGCSQVTGLSHRRVDWQPERRSERPPDILDPQKIVLPFRAGRRGISIIGVWIATTSYDDGAPLSA